MQALELDYSNARTDAQCELDVIAATMAGRMGNSVSNAALAMIA